MSNPSIYEKNKNFFKKEKGKLIIEEKRENLSTLIFIGVRLRSDELKSSLIKISLTKKMWRGKPKTTMSRISLRYPFVFILLT